jgi:hypothetical protein
MAKAERVIQGGSVSEGSHWTYTHHRHEPPANRLRAYQTEQLLVESSDLAHEGGMNLEQRLYDRSELPVPIQQHLCELRTVDALQNQLSIQMDEANLEWLARFLPGSAPGTSAQLPMSDNAG